MGVLKDNETKEKKVVGPLCGFVLLNSVEIDMDKIISDLIKDWGIDSNPKGRESDGKNTVFNVGNSFVTVSLMPKPIPNGEAEYCAESNYMWSEAVAVAKTHNAHIMVAVLPRGDMTTIEAGKLYVKVMATCLKQKNAIAVYTSRTVFQPNFYCDIAELMKDDDEYLPVLDLIYFGLYRSEKGNNVYTYGMKQFGKEDIEVLDSSHDLRDLRDFMVDIASYVIEEDVTLQDGETIGFSEEQKLNITKSKGINVEEESIKIEY